MILPKFKIFCDFSDVPRGTMGCIKRFSILFVCLLGFAACNKRDPSPELKDPLYQELESNKKQLEQEYAAALALAGEAEGNFAKVVPQTGQIKYATKRIVEARDRLLKIEQLLRYFEAKMESQKWRAREEYLVAHFNQKPWPNPDAKDDFKAMLHARLAGKNWSSRARREALGLPNKVDKPAPVKK